MIVGLADTIATFENATVRLENMIASLDDTIATTENTIVPTRGHDCEL